jgi:hypothetical protein
MEWKKNKSDDVSEYCTVGNVVYIRSITEN